MLGASAASAFTYLTPTDAHLLAEADGVLVATVGEPQLMPGRVDVLSYPLQVERLVAGELQARAELVLPGSLDPHAPAHTFTVAQPVVGERVLLFFENGNDGRLRPMQLTLGLFFEGTAPDGMPAWTRDLDGGHNASKSTNTQAQRDRDADAFERWIAWTARGLQLQPGYYLDGAVRSATSGVAAKGTLLRGSDGNGFRWFAMDAGTAVNWRAVASGQANNPADEFASLRQALAAWTDDPGSRIHLSYGGTVASDPSPAQTNGVHAVVWDDPRNEVSGSFSCTGGGVLAIGGAYFYNTTRNSNGTPYHEAAEGYVVTNDGAGCYFARNGGLNGAEVLTHEIGHTLGFGHACGDSESPSCSNPVLNEATMRASAHGDGRGAALRSDDRAIALLVYPDPNAGAPAPSLFGSGFE